MVCPGRSLRMGLLIGIERERRKGSPARRLLRGPVLTRAAAAAAAALG